MGVAVVVVEKRPSGAEKEPRRGDLSPDRGGRGRAAASIYITKRVVHRSGYSAQLSLN